MATVIDALVMTLGLDTSDYDKGRRDVDEGLDKTKKQSNAVAKEMFEGGKKAASFFSAIKTELIGLLAVAVAGKGLSSFLQDSIGGMAALGRGAAYLSMSAKEFDAWGMAVETVGGNAEGMKSSLQGLASGIEEFKLTGQSPMVGIFRAMGVSVTDSSGKVRAYGDLMTDLADKFKSMSGQDALAFGKRLGFDEGTINLLREGGPAVRELVNQMENLSGATQEGVESAQRNQAEWAKIRAHFKGIRETLSSELDPALEKIANRVLTWMDANHQLIATKIIAFVNGFVEAVITAVDWLVKADTATDGWSTKLIVAAGALRLLTGGGLIGGLGRLAAGLVGVSTAGLSAAAAIGALIGTGIYKVSEGSSAGDFFQKTAALIMSALGDKDAKEALQRDYVQQKIAAMSPERQAEYYRDMAAKGAGAAAGSHPSAAPAGAGDRESYYAALEQAWNLPAGMLASVEKQESGGNVNALSPKGAVGAFQILPSTGAEGGLSPADLHDERKSAAFAAQYLAKLRDMFGGDIVKGVAAYNAGPGNVHKYGGTPPFAETQSYVKSVMSRVGAASTAMARSPGSRDGNQSTVETHIGKIEVHTKATDADGMARDAGAALQRNQLIVAQANNGLS